MNTHALLEATTWGLLACGFLVGILCGAARSVRVSERASGRRSQGLRPEAQESIGDLQALYEDAPILLGVVELVDTDILHVYDNSAACRFLGVLPGQTGGRRESELGVDSEQTAEWLTRYRQSLVRRAPVRFEFKTSDGRWFVVTVCPVIERLPATQQFCFVAEDVSEWKEKIERALRERERLHVALEAGKLAFWDWDVATGKMPCGGEWEKLLGFPQEQLALSFARWQSLLHPEDAGRVMDAIRANLDGHTPRYEAEYRLKSFSGEWLWVAARGQIIERDGNQKATRHVGVIEDIHERRETRERCKQIAQQKDEFLATIVHELRNPLAPIRTGLEIVNRDPVGPSAQQARDMMGRQLAHLVRLIDDLLDVSRIGLGRLELKKSSIDVKSIVDTAVEGSKPFVDGQKHSLTVSVPEEPIFVFGDLTRLAQVVSNLINNAAKYTPNGGHIDVRVVRLPTQVSIQVQDNGFGVPQEMIERIFEMFGQVNQTLDCAQGGLGIGLALVRKLVELHDGTVRAESSGVNRGTTLIVTLPLEPNGAAAAPEPKAESVVVPGQRCRPLCIDDKVDGAESLVK